MSADLQVRLLAARDSFEALTLLLHRAYALLASSGVSYAAASQTAEETRLCAAQGQCLVAERQGVLVGTATVCGPQEGAEDPWSGTGPWFREHDTAHIVQFAVDPQHQGAGVGRRLVRACEDWAREHGYRRLALEVAEPATALRALQRRLGYAEIGHAQRSGKPYRAVVMQKTLDRSPLREHLQLHARYNRWATQRLCRSVDALPEADYRRDAGLFFGSVHGTLNHLLVAEQLLWIPRFAEGRSPAVALDHEAEPDRQRLRERLLDATLSWLPLLEVWPEERLSGTLRYRRMNGQQITLPFGHALTHVFNHGTHHRGQISAALTAMGHPCPEIDMVLMLLEEGPPA